MKKLITLFLVIVLLFVTSTGFAHPGRTDSNGGHWDRKNGTYHYHNSGSSGSGSGSNATQKPAATQKTTATKKPSATPVLKATISPNLISKDGYMDDYAYGETNEKFIIARDYPSLDAGIVAIIEDIETIVNIFGVFYDDDDQMWYCIWLEDDDEEAFILAESVDILPDEAMASGF